MNRTDTDNPTLPPPSPLALSTATMVERLCTEGLEETRKAAALAALLTIQALEQGHVCLSLEQAHALTADIDLSDYPKSQHWTSHTQDWAQILMQASPAVGTQGEQQCPLLYEPHTKRLYLQRYWTYEQRLAHALCQRLSSSQENTPPPSISKDGGTDSLSADQQAAVSGALNQNLTLISGGPGTGKTTTVARYLIAQFSRSSTPPSIALAAPTGKAAARLEQSLHKQIETGALSAENSAALRTLKASTLHRLLGSIPNSPRFKHDTKHPLPYDLVIVDEASMIDLPLMSKLFEALAPQTRILLLGDASQLASVSAGSVFSDLTRPAPNNPLANHIYELNTNFRFGEDSSIHRFCNAVKHGDAISAMQCFNSQTNSTLHLKPNNEEHLDYATDPANYASLVHARSPAEALEAMKDRILLAAVRDGPFGVKRLNRHIRTRLEIAEGACHGLPIIIKANDPRSELYNGDTGILFTDPDTGILRAWFETTNESTRSLPLSQIPYWQDAFALTIHESQGSEYNHVTTVLPYQELPHMTRELLYTAVSRARETTTILAAKVILQKMILKQTERSSGLLDAITTLAFRADNIA